MRQRRYSPADLRALLDTFGNPMVVLRRHELWMANPAFLQLVGSPREQVEGRYALDFVNPTERARISRRLQRLLEGQSSAGAVSLRRLVLSIDGKVRDVAASSQEVELEDGEKGLLVNLLELAKRPPAVAIAERLVETSARLVSASSEEDVRQVTVEGLNSVGLRARFLRWEEMDAAQALGALSEGHAVFGGADCLEASHVYLPLGDVRHGVLWVEGPAIDPAHGSALSLFSKVVGTALSEARVQSERARGQWELHTLAQVARFVAQPVPPTSEAFLWLLAELLSADAALLMLSEEPGTPLLLAAQAGLAGERPGDGTASLGLILAGVALESEHGQLSDKARGQALQDASEGRFGSGAVVRLTRAGQGIGVLQVLRAPGRPFQQEDARLLGTMVELLSTLLEQHRLRAESARQLSETRLLLDLARTTVGVLDSAGILDVAADFLVRLLDVSNCYIFLYEPETRMLRGVAGSAAHRDFFRTVSIALDSDTLTSRVARERKSLAIEDLAQARGGYSSELAQRFGEKALLGLPLTSRDDLMGVVMVADTRGPRLFGPALIELAEATCGQIALSIAHARLYEALSNSFAQLASARAEMVKRERLAALGELSAIVAHEVRNPLGVIFNAVAALRVQLKSPESGTGVLLDILSEESERLNLIVSDLLDYTRPPIPVLQPEDLRRLLHEVIASSRVRGEADVPQVHLELEVEPDLPQAHVDRRLIRQALINVIDNAVQAMPQGGVVKVRARREVYGGMDWVRTEVEDAGVGIPSELLHRIFEPFFTTKAQGTGLGLAVVRRILDEHGGEITMASTPGRGTTVIIRLPLQPSAHP
jgi:two-component system sensor histidine kinase HydH